MILNTQFRKGLDDFGEKWIGDFRDDQTKNTTASGNKRSRMSVWVIANLLDHPPHPSGKDRIHRGNAIDRFATQSRSRPLPASQFLVGSFASKLAATVIGTGTDLKNAHLFRGVEKRKRGSMACQLRRSERLNAEQLRTRQLCRRGQSQYQHPRY